MECFTGGNETKSFKVCAVTMALDSSEDELTKCLKPGGILLERRESLAKHAARLMENNGNLNALELGPSQFNEVHDGTPDPEEGELLVDDDDSDDEYING